MRFVRMQRFQYGGHVLRYRTIGSGPALVLVHGLSGSGRWWNRNLPALADHFTVTIVDLVGFGTNRAWRPCSLTDSADMIAALIGTLPGGRAHLVGHSMGGQICAIVAARSGERVDRLVLAAASGLLETNVAQMIRRLPAAARYGRFDFLPTLAYDSLRCGPLTLLRSAADLLRTNVSANLTAITAPTLLVWGDHDRLVPVAIGRQIQQRIPDAALVVLPQAGHVVMWDQATCFNQLVLRFLDIINE